MGEAKRRRLRGDIGSPTGSDGSSIRPLALAIDERVRQLMDSDPQLSDVSLVNQMVTSIPHLRIIWDTASDQELAQLLDDYPGFHRYAQAMEDFSEFQRN